MCGKGLEDGLAMRLPLSEPRDIYKDKLETDNRSNIGSEFNFEIDLPGERDCSTIYRLNLIKLYHRKPELANLVMENSSEGIVSETLYSVKLFMDFGFQGNLRKSQVYFKLPPDRSSYLRMINAKKKERFLPDPGTIVLRQKDINLVTGKPFRIKTCCSSQMLINSLREDAEYLLDLGVNGWGSQTVLCPLFAGVHYRLFSVWTLVPVRLDQQLSDHSTVDEIASGAADCRLTYTMANCPQRRKGERKREREKEGKRARKRQGLVVLGSGEENPRVLLGDADQESEMRMSKNALRTGRRQAVE
ncbi:uncharacterized protein TNCV_1878251 [Trichonephila clavipes]|nr:uncharacterized protein TNCV_1878251 [Trichonephila clavipes]